MIWHKRDRLNNDQRGFTLIEVIAVLAITALIGVGTAAATTQIVNQSCKNTEYTTISRNAMNAIFWISRDAQMAQTVTPSGATGFPLILGWVEWDSTQHQVTYSIEDDRLTRVYTIDGDTAQQTLVAQFIHSVAENTTCEYNEEVLTARVTATIGEGTKALFMTKEREITPRPNL